MSVISLEGCMICRRVKGIAAKLRHFAPNDVNRLRALCKTDRRREAASAAFAIRFGPAKPSSSRKRRALSNNDPSWTRSPS
jgi:hypothetical protein